MGEQHLNALSVTTRLLERWGRGQRAGRVLASEFDPLPPTELVDLPPFTAWLRLGIGHEHVNLLPPQFQRTRPAGAHSPTEPAQFRPAETSH